MTNELESIFNDLVRDYSERLYWHVRSMVNSHEDANDLVQDIYIKIWAALPSFRGESQLFSWVWRIATNETLSYLRKKKVRAALSFESYSAEAERVIDSDPFFDGDEAERKMAKAIATLPDKQRSVFCMRYYEDLSFEQIAQITGTSVGALKASSHIATEKIKKLLPEI